MPDIKAPDENKQFFWHMANAGNASKGGGSDQKSPAEREHWKKTARDLLAKARTTRLGDKKRLPEGVEEIVDSALKNEPAAVVAAVTAALSARAKEMVQAKYEPEPEPDHAEETEA